MSISDYPIDVLCDLLEHASNLSCFLSTDVSQYDSDAISLLQGDLHRLLEETSSQAQFLRFVLNSPEREGPASGRVPFLGNAATKER